jgi:hypothetical protein
MNREAKIPDLETRQRHVTNTQAACKKLEAFTLALDDLIAQLEAEMHLQSRSANVR